MSAPHRPANKGEAHEANAAPTLASSDFDATHALDALLLEVGISRSEIGGSISFAGQDPILASAHRLGACIGVPLMAGALAAMWTRCRETASSGLLGCGVSPP